MLQLMKVIKIAYIVDFQMIASYFCLLVHNNLRRARPSLKICGTNRGKQFPLCRAEMEWTSPDPHIDLSQHGTPHSQDTLCSIMDTF